MTAVRAWSLVVALIAVGGVALMVLVAHDWLSTPGEEPEAAFDDSVMVEIRRHCMDASANLDLTLGRDGTATLTAWPDETDTRVVSQVDLARIVASFEAHGFARMPRQLAQAPMSDSGYFGISFNHGATRKRVSAEGGSPAASGFHAIFHDVDTILGLEAWREALVTRARAAAESRRPK